MGKFVTAAIVQHVTSPGIQLIINLDVDLCHEKQSLGEVEIPLVNQYTTK
jgi:hypothetical protein